MSKRVLLLAVWSALMVLAVAAPPASTSSELKSSHVNRTVDLALLYYVLAVGMMLLSPLQPWREASPSVRRVRLCWSLAWLAFVIHVLFAFHHAHHWSHRDAMRQTGEESGFAEGIFVSYFFMLLWTADVTWWWIHLESHVRRPGWMGAAIHAFIAFIIFNGAVVYESGPVRWAGLTATVLLGALALRRLKRQATAD